MPVSRSIKLGSLSIGLALALFMTAAIAGTHGGSKSDVPAPTSHSLASSPSELANPGDLTSTISSLQARLQRLPSDYDSWSSLGSAYIQQARVSGDPSYYAKAQGAFRRALEEKPDGNYAALTGQAALAAGRHHFGTALHLARESQQINPYNSVNLGMLTDALVELGRYGAATKVVQRMVDLKPGVPSYTRVSYLFELRGNLAGARYAMQQAAKIAYSPDDKAFALFQLGELVFNAGNIDQAGRYYAQARALDADYIPPLYGVAKVEAAKGQTVQAVRDFREVVERYPSPTYVIEFSDLLRSLGHNAAAREQEKLVTAQEQLFVSAGVNLDLELALYDANHGQPKAALASARQAFSERKSVFVEDALAWALHVNGRDAEALGHAVHAARLGTQSALLAYHRGMIELSLGMQSAALVSLHRALDINPYFSPIFAPQARHAISQIGGVR